MKEKDIDKLFQDALSKREVEYNPANWDKMAVMLDEHPIIFDKGKFNYNGLIIGLTLLLSLLIFYGIKIVLNNSVVAEQPLNQELVQNISGNIDDGRDQYVQSNTTPNIAKGQNHDRIMNDDIKSGLMSDLVLSQPFEDSEQTTAAQKDFYSEDEPIGESEGTTEMGADISLARAIIAMDNEEEEVVNRALDSPTLLLNEEMNTGADMLLKSSIQEEKIAFDDLDLLKPISYVLVSNKVLQLKRPGLSAAKKQNNARFTLDVALGAGFVQDLTYSSLRGAVFAGIKFSRSYGFRTGLILSTLETPQYSGYKYESNMYGFGLEKASYDLEVNKNKSISIPLEFVYFKGKNSVYSGVEMEKIIASKGDLFVTNYSQFNGMSSTDAIESSIWVDDHELLPQANFNFILGYDYLLAEKFEVGIRMESPITFKNNLRVDQEVMSPNNSYWGKIYFSVKYKIFK